LDVRVVDILRRMMHEYWEKLVESNGMHRKHCVDEEVDVGLRREDLFPTGRIVGSPRLLDGAATFGSSFVVS
jgi:hypothetical protein